jgi:hypothetical protein
MIYGRGCALQEQCALILRKISLASSCIMWLNDEYTNTASTISVLFIRKLFPDDENRDGARNIGLFIIQSPDMAANPRKFY